VPAVAPAAATSAPRSVVVVGAGLAGAGTVTALRDQGFSGRVTVLGAEAEEPYDRPPLSKELLTRTTPAWLADEVGTRLHDADDVRLGTRATGLTLGAGAPVTVTTDDGEVRADAAVLATGAHAVLPAGWSGARTLHTAADAAALRADLAPGRRLVVVGAGWVGAEVAGVAAAAGAEVTVVEAASAPLATALGPQVGGWTRDWYAAAGIRLLTGARVAVVTPGEVLLEPALPGGPGGSGERLPADVVLVAVGARPSSAWLADALPLEPDGSVAVDEAFRALAAREVPVVAVGDLARRRSARHGWVPGGHWDGALRAPAIAVRRLLGGPEQPGDDLAPYVFSTQLGHELALYGAPGLHDDVVVRGDVTGAFSALWFTPGTAELTGVLAVDRPRDVAAARKLFAGPTLPVLDRDAVADPDRPLRSA
jgi:NADPH-dependent 2,4-dienoyl-CoA reductase/sulfur reductase-like enzyme